MSTVYTNETNLSFGCGYAALGPLCAPLKNACQDDPQKGEATGYVIPAKAGIQANSGRETNLDSRLRGNDESKENPAVKPHFHYL
jgi:hypothetical protein